MHRGFVPLHRKIKDNWIYTDSNKFGAWCKILIEANHVDKKVLIDGELIDCDRGQSVNSVSTWSRIFGKGWTDKKVRTFLKLLKNDSMIELEGLRKTSRITICNYESYNNQGNTEVKEKSKRSNTKGRERATNNNDNNVNNVKNDNKFNFKKAFLSLGVEENTLKDWLKVRKGKRLSNTESAYNGILNKIEDCCLTAQECIKESASNSWGGFDYEWVKNNNKNNNRNNQRNNEGLNAGFKSGI